VLTEDVKAAVRRVWDTFRSGGVSSPVTVIEQITYLLLIRRLEVPGWTEMRETGPEQLFEIVAERLFPRLLSHFEGVSGYQAALLRDAEFAVPGPGALARVLALLDRVPEDDRDGERELFDYLLDQAPGIGGQQLGTPQPVVTLMVEMLAPGPEDSVADPSCGSGGLLAAASDYVRRTAGENPQQKFYGADRNPALMRLAGMNLLLHGVGEAELTQRDPLEVPAGGFCVVMTNPPFGGSRDIDPVAAGLPVPVRTTRTELLFLVAASRLLDPGGRAAVIVPQGALFGSRTAHVEVRRLLVEEHRLDAVVNLPPGTFLPYTGLSTAVLLFTKADSGTGDVWFYDAVGDGRREGLSDDHVADVLKLWAGRTGGERTERSFLVPRREIADQKYDLSPERYRALRERALLLREKARRLGDIAEVFPGWVGAGELDTAADAPDAEVEFRVLHPSLLSNDLPGVGQLPVRLEGKVSKRCLMAGDIVGRDLASVRYWTVLPEAYAGVQAGRGLLVLRMGDDSYPAEYLAEYLSSPQAERQFAQSQGAVIPRLTSAALADVLVPSCDGGKREITSAVLRVREGAAEVSRIRAMLDESRGKIFENGTSAQRRTRLMEVAELSLLTAQNLRKQQEPYRIFQQSYPYGIARAVRRMRHSASVREKHEAALQCAESLILSLGILSLAAAADRGWRELDEVVAWSEAVQHGGVSFGHWLGVIRGVGVVARNSRDEVAGLADATATRKGGKGLIPDLDALVSLRNKVRHGGGPRTPAEVERSLQTIEPLVSRSLTGSSFLARSDWVYPLKLRWTPRTGGFYVSGLAVMGDHPDFEPIGFEAARPLEDERLHLVDPNREWFLLEPFCVLADCPSCLAPELYYPDRIKGRTAMLKSLDRGHEMESETVFAALGGWLNP
jgi:hypothetical protein